MFWIEVITDEFVMYPTNHDVNNVVGALWSKPLLLSFHVVQGSQ